MAGNGEGESPVNEKLLVFSFCTDAKVLSVKGSSSNPALQQGCSSLKSGGQSCM